MEKTTKINTEDNNWEKYYSKCCNSSIKVDCGEDLGHIGTCHYVCEKCGKPCDIL